MSSSCLTAGGGLSPKRSARCHLGGGVQQRYVAAVCELSCVAAAAGCAGQAQRSNAPLEPRHARAWAKGCVQVKRTQQRLLWGYVGCALCVGRAEQQGE